MKIGDWEDSDMYYHFAAFLPHYDKNKDVLTQVELTNTTDTVQMVNLTWKLYKWDAQTELNLLDSTTKTFMLSSGDTQTLAYTDFVKEGSVHLLVVEAAYKDSKSILNIRYVIDGINDVRINFRSVTSYPLVMNTEQTIFSCLHNTSLDTIPDGKMTLTLKDIDDKIIHSYTYEGMVTGAVMAVKDSFTPMKTFKTFTLEAKLYQGGSLVDEASMLYDCNLLGGTDCSVRAIDMMKSNSQSDTESIVKIWSFIILIILVVGLGYFMYKRSKRNDIDDDQNSSSTTFYSLLFLVVLITSSFGVTTVEAKSVVWNKIYKTDLAHKFNDGVTPGWGPGLKNFNITISRNAYMYKNGLIIKNGSTISVGDEITFTPVVVDTGISEDSPYGHWTANAARPIFNKITDYVGTYLKILQVYAPLSINPSKITYTHVGSSAGLNCNSDGSVCTITSLGVVKTQVKYSATYGKFYYSFGTAGWDSFAHSIIPMRICKSLKVGYGWYGGSWLACNVSGSDFKITVPETSISFTLTAIATGNQPPTAPIITHTAPKDPAI